MDTPGELIHRSGILVQSEECDPTTIQRLPYRQRNVLVDSGTHTLLDTWWSETGFWLQPKTDDQPGHLPRHGSSSH